MNGRKVESFSRMKDGNRILALEGDEVRKIWKDYFEDLYNIGTQSRLQSTCVTLMVFREVTTSEESQLGELK